MNSKHFSMSLLQASTVEHGRTALTEAVRKVQLLKIDGYCATAAMQDLYCTVKAPVMSRARAR
jgi:hypothetical protein